MQIPDPAPAPAELDDQAVRGQRRLGLASEQGVVVELLVEDHVRDVADAAQVAEVRHRPHRAEPGDEVGAGVEPQAVVGDLAHGQPPGGRRRDGDGEVGLALGEREQPRQRHHLHLEVGVVAAELVAGVDEQVVRRPVRRPDADRPREPVGVAADLLRRRPGHALHRLGVLDEAAARLGQRVALGRAVEEPGPERRLERGDPPARRRRVEPERPARRLEPAVPRDREEHPQVIPFHRVFLHGRARAYHETPAFLQGGRGRFCAAAGRDRG